jgi:DNA-binding NarL/FixJ family response regulator
MLQTASSLVGETLNTIDKMSYSLWPSLLTHLGLEAALLAFFDHLQENSEFQVDFEHYGLEAIRDANLTIMLYRIVQEALSNSKQHAEVDTARIKLWVEDACLRLQIEDTGRGFDVQVALNEPSKIGLQSILERTYLLNGELTILSSPSEGTRIYGSFPLNAQADNSSLHKPQSIREQQASNQSKAQDTTSLIRLAIADSNELSRWGYRAIIETDSRFKVISELKDWTSLRRFLEDVDLDILIMSHGLEGEDYGLLGLQELSEGYPRLQILLLSNYTEYAFAAQALKNGVSAYLLKTSSSEELRAALTALITGSQYLAKDIIAPKYAAANVSQIDAFSTLTEREREIFYRVVNGQTNHAIANELVLSPRTVETHRLNLMRKLGLSGTAALINFAINKGLVRRN